MILMNTVIAFKKLFTVADLGLDHRANLSWSIKMRLKYCFAKGFVFSTDTSTCCFMIEMCIK